MKIHVAIADPIGAAIKQSLGLSGYDLNHPDATTADVVIVGEKKDLEQLYTPHQHFLLIARHDPDHLPDNVVWINILQVMTAIPQLNAWDAKLEERDVTPTPVEIETGREYEPTEGTAQSLHILVIDDKIENLELARNLLGDQHFLTLAQGYAEGRRLIDEGTYQIVLCDCRMPLGSDARTALSIDAIEIGVAVPCGPYLVFPATKKGARVAIVTDANHHQDWTSALFDSLRDPQVINGQTVLFINNFGA